MPSSDAATVLELVHVPAAASFTPLLRMRGSFSLSETISFSAYSRHPAAAAFSSSLLWRWSGFTCWPCSSSCCLLQWRAVFCGSTASPRWSPVSSHLKTGPRFDTEICETSKCLSAHVNDFTQRISPNRTNIYLLLAGAVTQRRWTLCWWSTM